MPEKSQADEFASGFMELLEKMLHLPPSSEKKEIARSVAEAMGDAALVGGKDAVENLLRTLRKKLEELRLKIPNIEDPNNTPMATERVTSRDGRVFMVDTSDEACMKLGFHSRAKVLVTLLGRKGEVIGVASHNSPCATGDALWIRLEGEDTVCFFPDPMNDLELVKP